MPWEAGAAPLSTMATVFLVLWLIHLVLSIPLWILLRPPRPSLYMSREDVRRSNRYSTANIVWGIVGLALLALFMLAWKVI